MPASARAEAGELLFGTMETWLIWNLTGGPDGGIHVTDVTNASRTMLMDLRTLDWSPEICAAMLACRWRCCRRSGPPARSTARSRRPCVPGVRIAGAMGDQQAALFGQTCFSPGEAKCTYGTGSFVLLNTGSELGARSSHGMLSTVAYKLGDQPVQYALEGAIAVTGSLVQWFRDNLGLISTAPEIETLALTVADNGGCFIVPAFSGLFAPHWRPEARGVVVGLTSYITKGHLARAVLEASAWQTRDVVDAMDADSGVALTALKVDGGMTSNNLLMQTVADVLGVPVVRPMVSETVSLGAAYAAGLAVGYWPDLQGLRRNWHMAARWLPSEGSDRRQEDYVDWGRAVGHTFGWAASGRDRAAAAPPAPGAPAQAALAAGTPAAGVRVRWVGRARPPSPRAGTP